MKIIKYSQSNSEPIKVLEHFLGADSKQAQIWYEKFDYGTLVTSEGEKIDGHTCTHLLVAKVGHNDYRYLASIAKDQSYKYFEFKGYPVSLYVDYKGQSIEERKFLKKERKLLSSLSN